MKAITIWQPWASLLACGGKRFETRSWATSYRGPIAIHAAKKDVFDALALIPVPVALEMKKLIGAEWKDLPTGAVIATANLVGCHGICEVQKDRTSPRVAGYRDCNRIGTWIVASDREVSFGDWTPGRYAWELSDMKIIAPVPVSGRQGLWEWKEGAPR